jgi:hypothetical protein
MEPTKSIDAVAMTRRIREKHAAQLQDATPEERIRFYREKAARLEARAEDRRRAGTVVAPTGVRG